MDDAERLAAMSDAELINAAAAAERSRAAGDLESVHRRFDYHPPHGDQAERYQHLRMMGRMLATEIVEKTPASREQSVALTKLQETIMWANAAIAINEAPE